MPIKATVQTPRQTKRSRQAKQKVSPMLMHWRFALVLAVVVLVFVSLASRAAFIQIISPDMLIEQGDKRTIRVRDNVKYRGLITDRHGQQLAVSIPAQTIYADPKVIQERNALADVERWQALANVLNRDLETLINRVDDPKRRFVYLQRQVTPAMADFVRKLAIPGVYLRHESKRYYPMGEVSAHVVGFTDVDDKGQEGLERQYDQSLTSINDKRLIRRDAQGRQIEILNKEEGKQAEDLQLTIDQRIQALAYKEIKAAGKKFQAASTSVVIVNVHTGEILALANTPSFNPNNRSTVKGYKIRNRAISDIMEPGSSVKPLAVLAALEVGIVERESVVDTSPGYMYLGGSRISDARNFGVMSLDEIIMRSSNMGTSKLALQVPRELLMDTYYNMGLMSSTGLTLAGESQGLFNQRPKWSEHEVAALSFGYNIAVTATQLARMYATIANGGIQHPLSIVKSKAPTEMSKRVVSEENAYAILEMMETVTTREGSGYKARVPGYRVAGKTGTSRKAVAGGYGEEYVNIFAGIAPVSDPQIAIVVVINEPGGDLYHSGDTAAPTFSKIAEATLQLLNIPPDAPEFGISKTKTTAIGGG